MLMSRSESRERGNQKRCSIRGVPRKLCEDDKITATRKESKTAGIQYAVSPPDDTNLPFSHEASKQHISPHPRLHPRHSNPPGRRDVAVYIRVHVMSIAKFVAVFLRNARCLVRAIVLVAPHCRPYEARRHIDINEEIRIARFLEPI